MKVSFNCNNQGSKDFFLQVISALRDSTKSVKVRIGGYESVFNHNSIDQIGICNVGTTYNPVYSISFVADTIDFVFFNNFLKKLEYYSLAMKPYQIRIGGREFIMLQNFYGIYGVSFDVTDTTYTTLSASFNSTKDAINAGNINADTDDDKDDKDSTAGDSDEVIAVKEVIADKISRDVMFTAFDITKELRKNGNKVRHGNIRSIVHDLFRNGEINGYTRTIIDINGDRPFVYHPISSDASLYLI